MINRREKTNLQEITPRRLLTAALSAFVLLLFMMLMMSASADTVYAADKDKSSAGGDKPIREVHQVDIDGTEYCFFVTHNVVLTPEEMAEMTDEELSDEIIARSGLFIKKTNCKKPSHKVILPASWSKADRYIYISDSDIDDIRAAVPEEGYPVKLHMDLKISDGPRPYSGDQDKDSDEDGSKDKESEDTVDDGEKSGKEGGDHDGDDEEDEKDPDNVYSTYKKVSPRLMFLAVATEEDAAYGEDVCTWEDKPSKKPDAKKGDHGISADDKEDMLPEFRTIAMPDRSGGPLEDTLKDGDPVTLEWIEPAKRMEEGDRNSLLSRIPGGAAGLAVLILLLASAAGAAAYAAVKHRRS